MSEQELTVAQLRRLIEEAGRVPVERDTLYHEVVREELACQPCHGYFCAAFDKPQCILGVPVERVIAAIDRVMAAQQ